MITVMGKCAWDVVTDRLIWVEDGVAGLPGGLADGRYACLACCKSVMLKGYKPDAKVSPYFRHQNGADCADPDREQQVDAEMEVVIRLRDWVRAIPGFTGTVEIAGEAKGGPAGLPPVVIARCGNTTIAIERPGDRLPGPDVVRRRVRAVREHHGVEQHVWFLKKDRDQFGKLGTHTVRLGRKDTNHDTLAPNEQQQAIISAGGHVYWLDGKLVLVPYGIHNFQHTIRAGEDWTGWPRWPRWRDPRDDWRISKHIPSPEADRWGLVPIALSSMTKNQAVFRPAEAHRVMDELYTGQEGRYRWRRKNARELYAARHASVTPAAIAEPADAEQLTTPSPSEQQDAVPEPPAAPDQTDGQVPSEPSDRSAAPVASPAPPDRTEPAPTPEPPSSPPAPPGAPLTDQQTVPPPSAVPAPPPYPPPTPPAPRPEQRPRGLRGMLRRLLGGQ